jgi:hypothetical protein
MRVKLSEQHWAEIKPVEELTRADRAAVNEFFVLETDVAHGRVITRASADDGMSPALLERICTDWSLPFPSPGTDPKSLDRLPLDIDDALRKAIQPHIHALTGLGAPVQENEVPTPASVS